MDAADNMGGTGGGCQSEAQERVGVERTPTLPLDASGPYW